MPILFHIGVVTIFPDTTPIQVQINVTAPSLNPEEVDAYAQTYIEQLGRAKAYASPIVTQVVALPAFYPAEAYHQNYATIHPNDPYIMFNDAPKVSNLRKEFPELYIGK